MKTRDRIIQTALALFNEKGSKQVTTNHIAQAMGISPGNLYYHFSNKEAIIREINHNLVEIYTDLLNPERCLELGDIDQMLAYQEEFYQITWEYRFIHREYLILMQNDPLLNEQIKALTQMHVQQIKQSLEAMITAEQLHPLDEETKSMLITQILMIGYFWHPFLELTGQPITKESITRGLDMIFFTLNPYRINQDDEEASPKK